MTLSWIVANGHCVVEYQVEVNSEIIITNSALQQITLTLQSDETYSLRVRGADAANRIGEWSASYTHNTANPCGGKGTRYGLAINVYTFEYIILYMQDSLVQYLPGW